MYIYVCYIPVGEWLRPRRRVDMAGLCVQLRSISARTRQLEVKVTTKSKAPGPLRCGG